MKKTVMSILVSLSAVLLLASFSFAGSHGELYPYYAGDENAINLDHGPTINLLPSPGVQMDYSASANGQSCHMAAANEKGTKAYASASDFEGMLVSKGDYPDDEVFVAMPDEGAVWPTDDWMVMGSPDAALPSS